MFCISGRNLAIDIGTSNTVICMKGKGIVVNEPSYVALKQKGKRRTPIAFGAEAKSVLGKAPENVVVVRPIRGGIIADFETASLMLNQYIRTALKACSFVKPQIVVTIPNVITEVEKRAIRDAIEEGTSIKLVDRSMAAAVGAGLPVLEPTASMIVDIGGESTDVAVVSMGQLVCYQSSKQGGENMDEAIINYMRKRHQFIIGEQTAENIKKTLGSALDTYDGEQMEVRGQSVPKGAPAVTVITGEEIRYAISETITNIISTIRQTLEQTPPELAGDIMSIGLTLVGGGALLRGLAELISKELQVNVRIAEDPLGALAIGAEKCLEQEFSNF